MSSDGVNACSLKCDDLQFVNIFSANKFTIIQKYKEYKDKDIENHNFACWFVWVWNLVANTEGGTQAEGVWEQGAEENIWA